MPIFQLIYASGATSGNSADDIARILISSRRNNADLDVTGVLLYANGNFVQVLEGEEMTVRLLARRISDDRRHRNYMVLHEGFATERSFGAWQMGFRSLPASAETPALFRSTRADLEARASAGGRSFLMEAILAVAGPEFLAA